MSCHHHLSASSVRRAEISHEPSTALTLLHFTFTHKRIERYAYSSESPLLQYIRTVHTGTQSMITTVEEEDNHIFVMKI